MALTRLSAPGLAHLPPGTAQAIAPLDEALGLPARYYTDSSIFAAETERIFRTEWVPVARADELATGGDYVTARVGGEPVVVLRDPCGGLRALSNVCLHRGMVMLDGAGNASAVQCSYHQWSYGLDGVLRQAPYMGSSSRFDRRSVCLPGFQVAEWNGWVMVNLDPAAAPPGDRLAGLEWLCAPYGVERYRIAARISAAAPWNWKLTVENFAESYHHAGTHPKTLEPLFPARGSRAADNGGEPWFHLDHVPSVPGLGPFVAVGAFPLLLFSVGPFGAVWFRLEPVAADQSRLDIVLLENPERASTPQAIEALVASISAINDEDTRVIEQTQAGMSSRAYRPGRLSRLEKARWQFHRYLVDHLSRAGR
jgi:choline monooxygenase